MKIVGVSFYDGEFKYGGKECFSILVEEDDAFRRFTVSNENGLEEDGVWWKDRLPPRTAKNFPQVLGKFDEEMVSLANPVLLTDKRPSYAKIEAALEAYLKGYGVEFK